MVAWEKLGRGGSGLAGEGVGPAQQDPNPHLGPEPPCRAFWCYIEAFDSTAIKGLQQN